MNKKEIFDKKMEELHKILESTDENFMPLNSKPKQITEQEYESIFPNDGLAYIESLSETEKETYFALNGLYRRMLNEYISNVVSKYENSLKENSYNFLTVSEENQDFYQYYANDVFSYYYVRNNIYIERLSPEDLNYLQEKLNSKNLELTPSDLEYIARTFKTVITEQFSEQEIFTTNFGPNSSTFQALNNALVVGFRYDEFNLNGMTDEQWGENHRNQRILLHELNQKLQEELEQKLSSPVSVIEYNEYSVRPLNKKKEGSKVR